MKGFFIHTIELSYDLSDDEYNSLHENLNRFKKGDEYRCIKYENFGITIIFRLCNENEMMFSKNKDIKGKLTLIINPSRIICNNTYVNTIWNYEQFEQAIDMLDDEIGDIFENIIPDICGIDDLKLSRVDIAKDICDIPEIIIQEFILLVRRLPLNYGYYLNKQLEEKCNEFRNQDSINIINNSRKIEFVLYNKHQASVDMKYPDEAQKYYEDTLRMELRCGRKYIKDIIEKLSVTESLMCLYIDMEKTVKSIYSKIFKYGYHTCFVSYKWLKKFTNGRMNGKKKKKEKMLAIIKRVNDNPDKTLDDILGKYLSKKVEKTLMNAFEFILIIPVPIKLKDIAYIPPIDTMLEFEKPNYQCWNYYKYIREKSKGTYSFMNETYKTDCFE